MDEETQEAVEDVMSGDLTNRIKKNMKYATSGFIVGSLGGVLLATILGKCKICYGLAGGLLGGVSGLVISRKK